MSKTSEATANTSSRTAFFTEAFKGYSVPQGLRTFSEAFCLRFKVNGICDPAYVANVAAKETLLGDGQGNFAPAGTQADAQGIITAADRLLFAYATCISQSEAGITGTVIAAMLRDALDGAPISGLVPDYLTPPGIH